jgi:HEAT repeat protein
MPAIRVPFYTLISALALLAGPAAFADDVADLVKQLGEGSPDARASAALRLGAMGEAAKPAAEALLKALTDENPGVQRAAVKALSQIKPDPAVTLPLFAQVMDDARPDVALSVVQALAEQGAEVVPVMIKALADEDARYWAILVLAEIGPDAKSAVPELSKLLDTVKGEPEVRREIVLAMGSIQSPESIATLIQALDDQDPGIVTAAMFALGQMGADAKSATSALTKGMSAEDPFQRVVSAWAVAAANPGDEATLKTVVPVLVQGMVSKQKASRMAAAEAIAEIHPPKEILLPEIDKVRAAATPEMIADASAAIVAVGKDFVPLLVEGLEDPERRVRVARMLGEIGPDAAAALPAMMEAAADSDIAAKREIIMAVGRMGPAAKTVLPAIIKMLDEEDEDVRLAAAFALGEMGPDAASAASTLKKHVNSNDFYCITCAWALAKVAPNDPEAAKISVPRLIVALGHGQAFVRIEAAKTLGMLGAGAKDATDALKAAMEDPDPAVQKAAAEALKKIGA